MNLQVTKLHRISVTSGKGEGELSEKRGQPNSRGFSLLHGGRAGKGPVFLPVPHEKGKSPGNEVEKRGWGSVNAAVVQQPIINALHTSVPV